MKITLSPQQTRVLLELNAGTVNYFCDQPGVAKINTLRSLERKKLISIDTNRYGRFNKPYHKATKLCSEIVKLALLSLDTHLKEVIKRNDLNIVHLYADFGLVTFKDTEYICHIQDFYALIVDYESMSDKEVMALISECNPRHYDDYDYHHD